jgi:hypothetical protein
MVRQRVIHRAFQEVVKRGDEAARMQIQYVLGDDDEPVLFAVAKGVHSAE